MRSPQSTGVLISSSATRVVTDGYLSRLAHSTADTLITRMNDSLLDFDVLGSVEPATHVGEKPIKIDCQSKNIDFY